MPFCFEPEKAFGSPNNLDSCMLCLAFAQMCFVLRDGFCNPSGELQGQQQFPASDIDVIHRNGLPAAPSPWPDHSNPLHLGQWFRNLRA